jgi:FMN phosphatase YigB (HAD superfamily)
MLATTSARTRARTAVAVDVEVASFDVFDTLLTRAVGSPESAFLILGRWLSAHKQIDCSPEAFARARINAERRAYGNAHGECRLDAIYTELGAALRLDTVSIGQLMDTEQTIEAGLLRIVPGAAERVARARAAGQRIVFMSDMYLPPEFIRQELARRGLWAVGDGCYVSCETSQSKSSSALFRSMLQREHVPPRAVVHQGNSREHDIVPASRCGLRTDHFTDANLNGFEALLEQHTWATEGLASVMAGAARLARLSTPAANAREGILRDVAAGVAAPTLAGFVLWLLRRAQQLGLKRLYFLSRDGQLLLQIAQPLAARLGVTCELRYLFGSRQSWNLASVTNVTQEQLAWIWDSTDFLSVTSLLARTGLRPEQFEAPLRAAGLTREHWQRTLDSAARQMLRSVLQSSEVTALIAANASDKRRVLLAYLAQEGVLTSEPWGLVDLGWYGSMQNALSRLVSSVGAVPPMGFYFALFDGKIVDDCAPHRDAYYFDERTACGYLSAVPDLIPLMEMFCAGDHGTVVDFVERDGRVSPVLKEPRNQRLVDWGLPVVRRAIVSFVDNLVLDPELVNPWADVRDALTDVLRAFWVYPSVAMARAWSDFPWEDGLGLETYWNRLGQAYDWKNVVRALYRWRVEPHHRASWPAGSLMLSPRGIRFALARIMHLRRVWRSVRSRYRARSVRL